MGGLKYRIDPSVILSIVGIHVVQNVAEIFHYFRGPIAEHFEHAVRKGFVLIGIPALFMNQSQCACEMNNHTVLVQHLLFAFGHAAYPRFRRGWIASNSTVASMHISFRSVATQRTDASPCGSASTS